MLSVASNSVVGVELQQYQPYKQGSNPAKLVLSFVPPFGTQFDEDFDITNDSSTPNYGNVEVPPPILQARQLSHTTRLQSVF